MPDKRSSKRLASTLPAQRQDTSPVPPSSRTSSNGSLATDLVDLVSVPFHLAGMMASYLFAPAGKTFRNEARREKSPGAQATLRVPVILLLDVSASMEGEPMQQLKAAVNRFRDNIMREGEQAASLIDVAVVSFSQTAKIERPFTPVTRFRVPELCTESITQMVDGIDMALELAQKQTRAYDSGSIPHTRPIICMITDAAPTDDPLRIDGAIDKIRKGDRESNGEFAFYAAGVKEADFDTLRRLSRRPPIKLAGLDFRSLFSALANEVILQSQGRGREQLSLPAPTQPSRRVRPRT